MAVSSWPWAMHLLTIAENEGTTADLNMWSFWGQNCGQVQMAPCWLKGVSELGSIRWDKSRTNGKGIRLDFHWGKVWMVYCRRIYDGSHLKYKSRDDIVLSASWLYWGIVQSIVRFGQDATGKSISDGFDRFPLLPMFSVYYHQRPKQRMTFQFLNAYQKSKKHIYNVYNYNK